VTVGLGFLETAEATAASLKRQTFKQQTRNWVILVVLVELH